MMGKKHRHSGERRNLHPHGTTRNRETPAFAGVTCWEKATC